MPHVKQPHSMLKTVSHAFALLRVLNDDPEPLSFTEIVARTGMEQTACFRLLRTLEHEGVLRRSGRFKYASNFRILADRRICIGFATQGHDSFTLAVGQGLRWAADEHQVELIEMDNRFSQKVALRNAETLVKENVDLVIEFQGYDRIASKLSSIFGDAGIPVVAIEMPQPGATYFGVDNHHVGTLAGKALLRAAQREWRGECDELLLLDQAILGTVPHLRLSSAESVLRKAVPGRWPTTYLETGGEYIRAFELTRKHLRSAPKRRTLLTGIHDLAVLGALRAFEEAGRSQLCCAVGFSANPEGRRELRRPNTRLMELIAFFPECYGERVLKLSLDILHHREVPPAVYAHVQLLTSKNVDQFYPRDIFVQPGADLASC